MTAPRTLPALRAAVARVLLARGEAADALRVKFGPRHGESGHVCAVWPGVKRHPLELLFVREDGDESAAVAEMWSLVLTRLERMQDASWDAMGAAITERQRAVAALAVAREIGGGE